MEENSEEAGKENAPLKEEYRIIVIVGLGMLLLWFLLGAILPLSIGGKWEYAGTLGDSFGMVNSLFSGFAFVGVVIAIYLQNKEYRHQLREFSAQTVLQKENLNHQIAANQKQVELAEAQLTILKEERAAKEEEREWKRQPHFMLRVVSSDEDGAGNEFIYLKLHNGGAPVFDIRIIGGQHSAAFQDRDENCSVCAEFLDRSSSLLIRVEKQGLSGPLSEGSIQFKCVRFDRKKIEPIVTWDMPGGLSHDQTPQTDIFAP